MVATFVLKKDKSLTPLEDRMKASKQEQQEKASSARYGVTGNR
jgi:hypothetical protein